MIPPKPRQKVELQLRGIRILSKPHDNFQPSVIVGINVHNPRSDLQRCLCSVAQQTFVDYGVMILLDGQSIEEWHPQLPPELHGRTWIATGNFGSAARARNALLESVELYIPGAVWVARLDYDDRFHCVTSLEKAVSVGNDSQADFVVGGNLVVKDRYIARENPAGPQLLNPEHLQNLLRMMSESTAENELPSCNLVLRTAKKFRYPDVHSAEDHWLVSSLLIMNGASGAILEHPFYCDYSLTGETTEAFKKSNKYRESRKKLYNAFRLWKEMLDIGANLLGHGQEGIVIKRGDRIEKHFYQNILCESKLGWLSRILGSGTRALPAAKFQFNNDWSVYAQYQIEEETFPLIKTSTEMAAGFLIECLVNGFVCTNVKRNNFRTRKDGTLVYIDIGNDICPYDVSHLLDASARLYSVAVLGNSDEEVQRRPTDLKRKAAWHELSGFKEFYAEMIAGFHQRTWANLSPQDPPHRKMLDVALIIKACAMDWRTAETQIRHLVFQLEAPHYFNRKVLALDPYEGPFLRSYDTGNFSEMLSIGERLVLEGVLDEVIVAPADPENIHRTNLKWFNLDSRESHTVEGIPVSAQLWAFEYVKSRYILQCDIDILVARRDRRHNYLEEMLRAIENADTTCVAFNICKSPDSPGEQYSAPVGEYKPEVRCGLIDMHLLKSLQPLRNKLSNGKLTDPWYRALHDVQRRTGLKTVRGGNPDTYYMHPTNSLKSNPALYSTARNLVCTDTLPASFYKKWEIDTEDCPKQVPLRNEKIVFVCRGRNTPREIVERFTVSLREQTCQDFGIIIIDDSSEPVYASYLWENIHIFGSKLSYVTNASHNGRMYNLRMAIKEICSNSESFIVVLDLDDALFSPNVVERLTTFVNTGYDLVLAAPYRPDSPLSIYYPVFSKPRAHYGGDVWINFRSFKKLLFDKIPEEYFQYKGSYLQVCEDYATMIAMTEMAEKPLYVPEYWIWHKRTSGKCQNEIALRIMMIEHILKMPELISRLEQEAEYANSK